MRIRCVILVAALVSCAAEDTLAQGFPRRERPGPAGVPRETGEAGKRAASVPPAPSDPMAAIERELPSLKVDLRLSAEQLGAWSAFERDVRDVAEMGRARRRHVMALGIAPEGASALTLVQTVAEDDRMRAEGMADLRSHLQALYAALADDQRRLLDRRVTQSQTDPLGR
jgi:hypothetical protein